MATNIFLGEPPAHIKQWIIDHAGPVVKETTVVKYTAASGLPDWEGDIVGELTYESIPNKSDIAEVEIGSHVTSIGSYAFTDCTNLTSMTMPNSVTSIENHAFYCTDLTSVTIPNSVTSIGDNAFCGCAWLTSVTIGNGVTSIGADAFFECTSVNDVYCYPNPANLTWTEGDKDDF